jgi:hypothetical protein
VKFNFNDSIVVRVPPLEGETSNTERLSEISEAPVDDEPKHVPITPNVEVPDDIPEEVEGRGR